jgi:prepilin-type N-terminal cleavage/methylation domain-containing protein
MKNTTNKTRPARPRLDVLQEQKCGRKMRGTYANTRNSAVKRSRSKRGACDSSGGLAARPQRTRLWKIAKHKTGFTVAELLIALAISAILLAAVAVAINGSAINYQENEEMFKTINNARQALFRITTQLRTADAVDPNSASTECSFFTAAGEDITYQYRNAENKLYLITNSDGQEYVLCDNVTDMTFSRNVVTEDSITKVKSVQVVMTVQSGDTSRTIASAAVVRRNLN